MNELLAELRELLTCPITTELVCSPVLASGGHLYEREAINEWQLRSGSSPITRERLHRDSTQPRIVLKLIEILARYDPDSYPTTSVDVCLAMLRDSSFRPDLRFRIDPDAYVAHLSTGDHGTDALMLFEHLVSVVLRDGTCVFQHVKQQSIVDAYLRQGNSPVVQTPRGPIYLQIGEVLPKLEYLTYDYFRNVRVCSPELIERLNGRELGNYTCARSALLRPYLREADFEARLYLFLDGYEYGDLFSREEIDANKGTIDLEPWYFALLNRRKRFPLTPEVVQIVQTTSEGTIETLAHRALAVGMRDFAIEIASEAAFPIDAGSPSIASLLDWCPKVHAKPCKARKTLETDNQVACLLAQNNVPVSLGQLRELYKRALVGLSHERNWPVIRQPWHIAFITDKATPLMAKNKRLRKLMIAWLRHPHARYYHTKAIERVVGRFS